MNTSISSIICFTFSGMCLESFRPSDQLDWNIVYSVLCSVSWIRVVISTMHVCIQLKAVSVSVSVHIFRSGVLVSPAH